MLKAKKCGIQGFQLRASYVNVADGAAFWRENDNLLIFRINSDNWSCSGMDNKA